MLNLFILGLAVLIAFALIAKWYVGVEPKALLKGLKWVGFALAMVVLAWLVVTGKLWAALAALPAMLMWFLRLFTGLRYFQMLRRMINLGGAGGGWSSPGAGQGKRQGAGQGSSVRTRFFDMRLDHETGQVAGEVLEGRFAGRALDDLTLDELIDLMAEVQADPDSVRVLESYLDRRAPDWRTRRQSNGQGEQASGFGSAMTRAEALKVLGLQDGASRDEIKAAHRRLMAQVHPDHGGSDYLAQQINAAKDVLLEKP